MVSSHPESSPAPLTVGARNSEADELRGGLLMSASMCCFILNDTVTKLLSTKVGIGEFVFLRGLFATAIIFGLVTVSGHFHRIRFAFDRKVVIRALLDLVATGLFIAALFHMPLPNLTAVMQAVPLTATLLAMLLLGERVGRMRLAAIAVGLVGVLLIVKPGSSAFNPAVILATGAMLAVAMRDLVTRNIRAQIPSAVVTLTTAVLVTLGGAAWSAIDGLEPMSAATAMMLALAALFLIAGQFLTVQAVRVAGIAGTAPFRYTIIAWSLMLGWAVFGFIPDSFAFIGIVLIAGSGLYTILESTLKQRQHRWFRHGSSQP
jgi:drug/metabolite transporter (DMT)-like permease